MQGDLNLPEEKQKQESIPAGEGSNRGQKRVDPQLSRTGLGNALLKRFSADGQNTTQNYTTMRVVVTKTFWTAFSPQKIYNQSFMRKLRSAVVSLKRGKSAVVDTIPEKLVQAGGETIT